MKKIVRAGHVCAMAFLSLLGYVSMVQAAGENATGNTHVTKAGVVTGLDFTGWVPTDLSKYDPEIKVILSLPKTAKIEKGILSGLDITIDENYSLNVYNAFYESVTYDKEALANKEIYAIGKILKEEPHGLIFTYQLKQIKGFDPYETETHFIYYIGNPNVAIFKIKDVRPFANFTTPEEFYNEANATQLYDYVKASAKLK